MDLLRNDFFRRLWIPAAGEQSLHLQPSWAIQQKHAVEEGSVVTFHQQGQYPKDDCFRGFFRNRRSLRHKMLADLRVQECL